MAETPVTPAPGTSMVVNVGFIVLMTLLGASVCEYAGGTQRTNKRTVSACLRRVVGRNVIARLRSIADRHCDQLNRIRNSPKSMVSPPAAVKRNPEAQR